MLLAFMVVSLLFFWLAPLPLKSIPLVLVPVVFYYHQRYWLHRCTVCRKKYRSFDGFALFTVWHMFHQICGHCIRTKNLHVKHEYIVPEEQK